MNYNLDEVYESATQRITERRPLIVISGNFGEPGCTLGPGYYEAVLRAGGLPLIVPPTNDLSAIDELLRRADGILLSGRSRHQSPVDERRARSSARNRQSRARCL